MTRHQLVEPVGYASGVDQFRGPGVVGHLAAHESRASDCAKVDPELPATGGGKSLKRWGGSMREG